ncbi:MAG: cyclic nucleotide-binding domain-containing protein [Clostridiales bacterium]|jgi:CRP-like cAMP-binding protein|nr:cyclic nucleotide-binding domain-containing protein [Clostridiales bacterium]
MINVEELKGVASAKNYPRGTVIIQEGGQLPHSMYIVLKGKVRVLRNFRMYNEVNIAELGVGEFFGEMSLFLLEPRTATVVTIEESIILEIDQLNAYEIFENYPEMGYRMLRALCQRIKDTSGKIPPPARK